MRKLSKNKVNEAEKQRLRQEYANLCTVLGDSQMRAKKILKYCEELEGQILDIDLKYETFLKTDKEPEAKS